MNNKTDEFGFMDILKKGLESDNGELASVIQTIITQVFAPLMEHSIRSASEQGKEYLKYIQDISKEIKPPEAWAVESKKNDQEHEREMYRISLEERKMEHESNRDMIRLRMEIMKFMEDLKLNRVKLAQQYKDKTNAQVLKALGGFWGIHTKSKMLTALLVADSMAKAFEKNLEGGSDNALPEGLDMIMGLLRKISSEGGGQPPESGSVPIQKLLSLVASNEKK